MIFQFHFSFLFLVISFASSKALAYSVNGLFVSLVFVVAWSRCTIHIFGVAAKTHPFIHFNFIIWPFGSVIVCVCTAMFLNILFSSFCRSVEYQNAHTTRFRAPPAKYRFASFCQPACTHSTIVSDILHICLQHLAIKATTNIHTTYYWNAKRKVQNTQCRLFDSSVKWKWLHPVFTYFAFFHVRQV